MGRAIEPVVVIGGGAAGIIAAWRAASLGARVILLEKTPRLGTKILISGGGKCNITHDGPLEDVLRAFRPNEARFIRPACYRFTNREIVEMLTSRGLEVYTRPDGRIFPTHGTAKDVVAILADYLREAGVQVRLETPVAGIQITDGVVTGVQTATGLISSSRVIVATGGSSYPASGTTGDGWKWLRSAGHTIVKLRAALAPMYMETPRPELSGIAFRDCVLKARQGGKEAARWRDDMLFTHRGVSGPTVLGISRAVSEAKERGEVLLEVDTLPDLTFERLGTEILEAAAAHPKRLVRTWVETQLPERLALETLVLASIVPEMTLGQLPAKSRNRLIEVLKACPLGSVALVNLEKGEVVAGGVALDEVDPHTMASRRVSGLFLCGEALDIAGPVGGYNLQAAFATGFVAGESAAGG